ncbi:hypothetical protein [Streptomyces sp. NPDC002553]|uniref:hypothetical protein n=1 Tax=Streptomyces sp. NPDC002553 TaxID=3154417 RepID=UPI00331D31A8
MDERGIGQPHPAEQVLRSGDTSDRVRRVVVGEAYRGIGGACVHAAQNPLDRGVNDGVVRHRRHEQL